MKYLKLSSSIITLFISSMVMATPTINSQMSPSIQKNTQETNTINNSAEENKWTEWGLTKEDWTKYKKLKEGSRGVWSPNLDPITTLGVEAKTEAERDRYAEILAKKEYERTEKELAFQIAYSRAFQRLYPNQLPFNPEPTSFNQDVKRIIYFTKISCETCRNDLNKIINQAGNTPLDIYFIDAQNDQEIRDWAKDNNINIEKVKLKLITLNYDKGYWLKYAKGKIPTAFKILGDGEWEPLIY